VNEITIIRSAFKSDADYERCVAEYRARNPLAVINGEPTPALAEVIAEQDEEFW
jgi:hypothetical protein